MNGHSIMHQGAGKECRKDDRPALAGLGRAGVEGAWRVLIGAA